MRTVVLRCDVCGEEYKEYLPITVAIDGTRYEIVLRPEPRFGETNNAVPDVCRRCLDLAISRAL